MTLPIELLSDNFVKTRGIMADTPFKVYEIDAAELLCPSRIDLAAKLAYIDAYEKKQDMTFAKELYRKHIEAFSEGYYTEPGDGQKTNLEQFFAIFNQLIEDFKLNGFDSKKSLIPVGVDNIILDGAHRTACAIYFHKKVSVISFPALQVNFDYSYFRKRKLSEEMLEYMAQVYSQWSTKRLYMACLWPIADKNKRVRALSIIQSKQKIIFETRISLSRNGLRNLMLQIYRHQDWVGSIDNHFAGVMGKVDSCYCPSSETGAILFEGSSLDRILEMKEEIREIFGVGKHAIHISDTNEETILMAELLLQNSSRHALNYGNPDAFANCYQQIINRKEKNACFSEFATLAYYGLSEHMDVTAGKAMINVSNPRTYFVFGGAKVPSLEFVCKNKPESITPAEASLVEKLVRDTMGNLSLKRKLSDLMTAFSWKKQAFVLKLKQIAMVLTQKIGLYESLHKLYHREM